MAIRLPLFALTLSLTASTGGLAQTDSSWQQSEVSWRARHEQKLLGPPPDGWLSLVAGYPLTAKTGSLGSATDNQINIPGAAAHLGALQLRNGEVRLTAPAHGFPTGLQINGRPATAGILNLVGKSEQPSVLTYDSLTLYAVFDDDAYDLYVFDSKAPARQRFAGLHWYPLNERYLVTARWQPFAQPQARAITTHQQRTAHLQVPGQVEFSWNGTTYRLEPTEIGEDVMVFSIHDTTNRSSTYDGGRFLTTAYPSAGLTRPGTLQLDFNQLRNPPSGYSTYANCPLAPEQNQLPFALEAGEMNLHPK